MLVLEIIAGIIIVALAIYFGLFGLLLEIVFAVLSGGSSSGRSSGGFGGGDSGGGGSSDDF